MKIKELNLLNFRNYKKEKIELSPNINILIGNNASGKTNVLESIYTLALTRSYKAKDKDLVLFNESFYRVSALIEYFNREDNLLMIGSEEGKKVFKNGLEIQKLSDFIGKLNVVMFSPDDIIMFKGGPLEKRKLIDMSLLQISKDYIENYTAFKKQIKLRNDYLKYLLPKTNMEEEIEDDMLDILTINFIDCNKKIYEARCNFLSKLNKVTEEKYKQLSGEDVSIKFEYSINFENDLNFYKKRYKSDIQTGSTQCGIHRDDIKFYKNDKDFELNCSQGESRMLALSIKLALAEILKKLKQETPIVLLDDVFSELDKNHQNRLLKMLDKSMQIIITTTDLYKISKESLNNSKVFTIKNSSIKETIINGWEKDFSWKNVWRNRQRRNSYW